ncbi:MAG: Hsp20/alpha crystallin family protein [Verrucomicrobiales bacterium]
MNLIQYNDPTSYLNNWDSFFADPFRAFAPLLDSNRTSAHRDRNGRVEWYEDEDNFYARVELAGVKKEDLHLDAEEGLIRLAYERVEGAGKKKGESMRTEKFEQVFRSPAGVETSKIEAKLSDGILELTLPKAEKQKKPFSIEVK